MSESGSAEQLGLTRADWSVSALLKLIADLIGNNPVRAAQAETKARLMVATYFNA